MQQYSFGHSRCWLLCSLCLGTVTLLFIGLCLDRGFDLSDESTFLIHMTTPFAPLLKSSDYGTLLHLPFTLLGQDVYALRLASFCALLLAALFLGVSLLRWAWFRVHLSWPESLALVCAPLFTVAAYYDLWRPTPCYDTLAFLGIMCSMACLILYSLLMDKGGGTPLRRSMLLGGLAVAGVVTLLGKASSAAALACLAVFWIARTGCAMRGWRGVLADIATAGGCSLLLLVCYFTGISEGFFVTWQKILLGVNHSDTSHGIDNVLKNYKNFIFPYHYWGVLLFYPLLLGAVWSLRQGRTRRARGLFFASLFSLAALSVAYPTSKLPGLILPPFFCAALFAAWPLPSPEPQEKEKQTPPKTPFFLLGGMLALSGFAYHSGTDVEVEQKLMESFSLSATGIMCILLTVDTRMRARLLTAALLMLCCMTTLSLNRTVFAPQRNGAPMWTLSAPVRVGAGVRPLLVHKDRQAWIGWLRETARQHGWEKGTPLVYTSVMAAGALPLLEGTLLGSTWPGDTRYMHSLEQLAKGYTLADPSLLRKAWILRPASDGPRHMPTALLAHLRLPFPQGYTLVGRSPDTGIWPAESYELWKPLATAPAPAKMP